MRVYFLDALRVILLIMLLAWAAAITISQTGTPTEQAIGFLDKIRIAAKTAKYENIRPFFNSPDYTKRLESMIGPPLMLRSIGISLFPAPPGYETFGDYWIVFYRYQQLEADHNAVFPVIRTGEGPRLGSELPVDFSIPYRFASITLDVKLMPAEKKASFVTTCDVKRAGEGPETVYMRMNDPYTVQSAKYNGAPIEIFINKEIKDFNLDRRKTQLVQSGGILYLTKAGKGGKLELRYEASLDIRGLDKTTEDFFLLTSYWYPTIGLQPAPSRTFVTGPSSWLLKSDGNQISEKIGDANTKTVEYRSDVPLTWYHIVAGPYKIAYEVRDRGRIFRSYQLTIDEARAKHDAEMARDAVAFFEDRFGKFPFNGYDVVDTPDFYGVECYSFTVLTPRITSWATSHEIGHTYFGGLVPNTYLHSIWNESMTQYIDSSQFKNNSDGTLNNGYNVRRTQVALAEAFLPHGPYGNVGYYRGAYTMKMLENELGLDVMNACLKQLVKERVGKVTEWSDVEKSFSATAKRQLGWFFDQWVRGKAFPTIAVDRSLIETGPRGGYNTNIIFSQTGTGNPFRLKFEVVLDMPSGAERFSVTMTERQQQFDFGTKERPTRITINTFGWTLADGPAPITP